MLLDKFEVGKRYRFNKELLLNDMEKNGWSVSSDEYSWVDDIHLKEVTILGNRDAYVGGYAINPEWCEEIVTEPLKTRDDIKGMYEQLLHLEELEELLDAIDEYMPSGRLKSNFLKCTNSEIERVIDELGLEE